MPERQRWRFWPIEQVHRDDGIRSSARRTRGRRKKSQGVRRFPQVIGSPPIVPTQGCLFTSSPAALERYIACPKDRIGVLGAEQHDVYDSGDPVKEDTVTTATLTEADVRVRDAVMRQLDWDPEVDASAVGVAAKSGTVTLTGFIDTYSGKLAAERAAKRVHGVRAVANDIEVRLRLERTDADIALDAARALELCSMIPESVQAIVHNGHLTLTGKVEWLYQKESAERAVRHIRAVRSVLNHITVAPTAAVS